MGAMGKLAHGGMADPFTVRSLCEWPMLTALLAAFGIAVFAAVVLPAESELDALPVSLWSALRGLTLVALVMALPQLLIVVAAMTGTVFAQSLPLTPEVLRQTHFGRVWLASLPPLLLLTVAAWIPGQSRGRAGLIALAGAAVLVLRAPVSHAIDYGVAAMVLYFVHEAAAGLWGGALVGLWMTAPEMPGGEQIVKRVSRLCGWCVAMLVISGSYLAYRALGFSLDHLLYSAYGRMLIAKLSVFAILVATGGYNRYWLVPQFGIASARNALIQSVRVECFLILGVFALAVLLANTPPSH
jgi:putative copper resistance protein D